MMVVPNYSVDEYIGLINASNLGIRLIYQPILLMSASGGSTIKIKKKFLVKNM